MAHKPYAIKLELVRGCTARCPFCALRHMPWVDEEYRYMSIDTFTHIMLDLQNWLPKFRLEFANRGEPTLHPDLLEMTRIARKINPKCQILLTSNTDLMVKNGEEWYYQTIKNFYEIGGNIALLDCYVPNRYQKVMELFNGKFSFVEQFFGENEFNPYHYRNEKFKALCIKDAAVYEGAAKENKILYYHNQGGNAHLDNEAQQKIWTIEQPKEPLQKMCVRPFRELTIHYDGTVPVCCDDWSEQQIIGKTSEGSLIEIWYSNFNEQRKRLLSKDRTAMPCNKCSVGAGNRVGLEMNWFENKQEISNGIG